MVFLIIAMCLINEPKHCTEASPYEAVTLTQCAMNGEAGAVEFLADHPKWQLLGWKCEAKKEDEEL